MKIKQQTEAAPAIVSQSPEIIKRKGWPIELDPYRRKTFLPPNLNAQIFSKDYLKLALEAFLTRIDIEALHAADSLSQVIYAPSKDNLRPLLLVDYPYRGSVVDMLQVHKNNRATEYIFICNPDDFVNEFSKFVNFGKFPSHKHGTILAGKWCSHRQYIVTQSRWFPLELLPDHLGLIEIDKDLRLTVVVKIAPLNNIGYWGADAYQSALRFIYTQVNLSSQSIKNEPCFSERIIPVPAGTQKNGKASKKEIHHPPHNSTDTCQDITQRAVDTKKESGNIKAGTAKKKTLHGPVHKVQKGSVGRGKKK